MSDYDDRAHEAQRRVSAFIELADMEQMAQADPIIEPYLERDAITLLYGAKDVFKSFLAIDWACCVATGTPWKNFPVVQGLVVYVAGEGSRGLYKRVKAWSVMNDVSMDVIGENLKFTRAPMQILDADNQEKWAAAFEEERLRWGRDPLLLILDTLATNFGPGSENDPTDGSRFMAHLKIYYRARYRCGVLVVHHEGKASDKGARGASSLTSDADNVLKLKREKPPEHENWQRITLYCDHIKDAEKSAPFTMESKVVEIDDESTSLVLARFMTEEEILVRTQSNDGLSQREIAQRIGKAKTHVARIQKRLKDWHLLAGHRRISSVSNARQNGGPASVSTH
jgi:hypothetical protein